METLKENQIEIVEFKNMIFEVKHLWERLYSKMATE